MAKLNTDEVLNYLMPNVNAQWEICDMLTEFAETFESSEDPMMWYSLIIEELLEWFEEFFLHGFTPNLLKEYCDILYVTEGFARLHLGALIELPEHLTQEQVDRGYSLMCTAANVTLSVCTTEVVLEAFKEVHRSNMSKKTKDGQVLRREDGKILKSDQYTPADMTPFVNAEKFLSNVKYHLKGEV